MHQGDVGHEDRREHTVRLDCWTNAREELLDFVEDRIAFAFSVYPVILCGQIAIAGDRVTVVVRSLGQVTAGDHMCSLDPLCFP
jgi:hypothetical protein